MEMIYLHGFNSSGKGETVLNLRKKFPELLAIDYDYINADNAFSEINDFIINLKDWDIILIGTSLGGFWANYFAQKYDLKCVLFNPALEPDNTLKKYIGENLVNYTTSKITSFTKEDLDRYRKYQVPINKGTFRTSLLGRNDEVIDHKKSAELLKGTHVIYTNDKHRIADITPLAEQIEKTKNIFVSF